MDPDQTHPLDLEPCLVGTNTSSLIVVGQTWIKEHLLDKGFEQGPPLTCQHTNLPNINTAATVRTDGRQAGHILVLPHVEALVYI